MEAQAPSSDSLEVKGLSSDSLEVEPRRALSCPQNNGGAVTSSKHSISPDSRRRRVLTFGSFTGTEMILPVSHEESLSLLKEGTGTTGAAAMQVMLTCLGIAALCMPYLFAQVGWGLGTAILVVPAAVSCVSMRQIAILGDLTKKNTMAGAFSPYVGSRVGLIISIIFFILFEFIVAACMAIPCDILPSLVPDSGVDNVVVGAATVLFAACCGFVKDLKGLDAVLSPSIFLVLGLMVYVVARALLNDERHEIEFAILDRPNLSKRLFDTLSTAWTAFGAECAMLAIFFNTAPEHRTSTKPCPFLMRVIDFPMFCLLAIYFTFGLAGYSQYGSEVEANLLLTMGNEMCAIFAKIGLSFVNAARVPLFNVVQWHTVLELFPVVHRFETVGFGLGRCILMSLMNITSLALLLFLDDFGKVLALIGGIVGIPVFTLLPGLAWLSSRYCPTVTPRMLDKSMSHYAIDAASVVLVCFACVFYVANLASYF